MLKHRPPHPGTTFEEIWMKPVKLDRAVLAEHIKVDVADLNAFLDGERDLDVRLAARLGKAVGPRPQLLLGLQASYDLSLLEDAETDGIEPLELVFQEDDEDLAEEAA